MSVNRDMRLCILQRNSPIKTTSGASKDNWKDAGEIEVAIHKKNDYKVAASEKYIGSTHTGLTHCKEIETGKCRLKLGSVIYEITDCNTESRFTNLLLKVIENG